MPATVTTQRNRPRGAAAWVAMLCAVVALLLATAATAYGTKCQRCTREDPGSGGAAVTSLLAQHYLTWQELAQPGKRPSDPGSWGTLPGNDKIIVEEAHVLDWPDRTNSGEIELRLGRFAHWWKGITLYGPTNQKVTSISAEWSSDGAVMTIKPAEGGSLVFSKAGFLGFPVDVYQLGNLRALQGVRTVITWYDDCPGCVRGL